MSGSRQFRQSDLAGAASGSGYGGYCPEGIPVEFALLSILAAFGVAFGILYRTFTLETGGRKKRSEAEDYSEALQVAADYFWHGKTKLKEHLNKNHCHVISINNQ